MWFQRNKRLGMSFESLEKLDSEIGDIHGYSHSEVNALVAPIFGLTAEEMCGMLLIAIQHDSGGHHHCLTVSDLPAEAATGLLARVMWNISHEGSKPDGQH